jgi:hypothetical protein
VNEIAQFSTVKKYSNQFLVIPLHHKFLIKIAITNLDILQTEQFAKGGEVINTINIKIELVIVREWRALLATPAPYRVRRPSIDSPVSQDTARPASIVFRVEI